MANYSTATVIPSVEELSGVYPDQSLSADFVCEGLSISKRMGIHVEDLTKVVTDYLLSADSSRPGVEDLLVLMSYLNQRFQLGLADNDDLLYKAVKALPHFSPGRIGYTHRRRKRGTGRGVFVFLFH